MPRHVFTSNSTIVLHFHCSFLCILYQVKIHTSTLLGVQGGGSLVPRPRPAFRHLQYHTWGEPGNEARMEGVQQQSACFIWTTVIFSRTYRREWPGSPNWRRYHRAKIFSAQQFDLEVFFRTLNSTYIPVFIYVLCMHVKLEGHM